MKVSLPTLRLLLGMLTLLLISACSDDGSSSSNAKTDLKTTNIYFTQNEIRSFNPNTGLDIPLADYGNGEHKLLMLNTDNDKEGYEEIIYTNENTIYSMDTETLIKSSLASVLNDTEVCIFPNTIPDQSAFEGSTKGDRILVDHTSIFITPKTTTECDTEAAKITKVDFTDKDNITIREISAANLWGDTILDDTGSRSNTNDDGEVTSTPGRYGFLGSNFNSLKSSVELSFYDHENNTLWATSFPVATALPTINQVTPTDVLIQINGELYLKSIEELFQAGVVDSGPITPDSKVAALFDPTERIDPLLRTDISELQIASNGNTFAIEDDGKVFFYDETLKKFRSLEVEEDTVLKVQIKMTDDGTLLLHRTFANTESLLRINTTSDAIASIVNDGPDHKINFQTEDNNIYINTSSQTDWQAEWINPQSTSVSYDKSMFVFSKNSRAANADTEIFLIASDEEITTDGNLTQAKLYAFDPGNIKNGRKQYRKDKNSPITDFIFGEFSVDIKSISSSEITNDIYGRLKTSNSETFNDVYGKLELNVIREDSGINSNGKDTYFFNPSETDSHEEGINKTLQRIEFEEDTI